MMCMSYYCCCYDDDDGVCDDVVYNGVCDDVVYNGVNFSCFPCRYRNTAFSQTKLT